MTNKYQVKIQGEDFTLYITTNNRIILEQQDSYYYKKIVYPIEHIIFYKLTISLMAYSCYAIELMISNKIINLHFSSKEDFDKFVEEFEEIF